ncbi:MAG: hybrid sensor histidine kinase/response regulator [Cytophagaceae bacterium]
MEEKISVLYLDDDEMNLHVFKAGFRQYYRIFLAQTVEEAYEVIRNNELQVILADQKMPQMTGVEFFENILNEFPEIIRILITGFTDIHAVIDAINKGKVYHYIKKPWDENEIRVVIDNAGEVYRTRQLLKQRTENLKKVNEELTRFVYSASHELKSPLMTILGILKVAGMDEKKDPTIYFDMIEKSVKNLDVFIKNIVNYYKNARIDEPLADIKYENIVFEIIESYKFYDRVTDVKFIVDVDQNHSFTNDEFRVRVIINNILSNAIKYQQDGVDKLVKISVKTTADESVIIIEDNGIGIAPKHLPNIFKMFFRATHHNTGSGIGLYIVKEAVDRLGGVINVESTEGVGSKFVVKLPNRVQEKVYKPQKV